MKKKSGNRKDADWAEAKRLCRLSADDVRKAKHLNISPRSLIKNRPSKSQPWKAPVHVWVRELYDRMLERSGGKRERTASQSVMGETSPTAAREPHGVHDSHSKHPIDAHPARDPERTKRSELDPANILHPEWALGRNDDGDDCPF